MHYMSYINQQRVPRRNFDCFEKKDFTQLEEKPSTEHRPASSGTVANRVDFRIPRNRLTASRKPLLNCDEKSDSKRPDVARLEGGYNRRPAPCKFKRPHSVTPPQCNVKDGVVYRPKASTNVTVTTVDLNHSVPDKNACFEPYRSPVKRAAKQTRGTQTLYRESSAQTLPYLPPPKNKQSELDTLEIFQMPKILPGDGPPGLYEVDLFRRARKRIAFVKALKENFRRQLIASKNMSPIGEKYIMEAFEWEQWMEREDYITHCQMLRLELVIRMFEEREKKMHASSKSRIEICCENIKIKREAALRRNELEYKRQIRRLEMSRVEGGGLTTWKESIAKRLGDPYSEFFAPQMRYGVNPNRRHSLADSKAFQSRIDALELKAVNLNLLTCPFKKLQTWCKPKESRVEVELNFCSDDNLKKLYEQLTNLRRQSSKQKSMPKCLKEKAIIEPEIPEKKEEPPPPPPTPPPPKPSKPRGQRKLSIVLKDEDGKDEILKIEKIEKIDTEVVDAKERKEDEPAEPSTSITDDRPSTSRKSAKEIVVENRAEELDAMLAEYEGSTIGWVMKFLCDEMTRLQEQRNLHFLAMLAQKERWRREAAEAGLRQKENVLREIYEQIFQHTNEANIKVCSDHVGELLEDEAKDYAHVKAAASITKIAEVVDRDIQYWLDSFKSVQNPLNYRMLRHLLKDLIFPDVDVLRKRYEAELIVDGVITECLMPHVEKLLDISDITKPVSDYLVDQLIDNDLYTFSDDCSVRSDASEPEREAHAIVRKLIRRAVPGRRWMTDSERSADVCIGDILDEVFNGVQQANVEKQPESEALPNQSACATAIQEDRSSESSHSENERLALLVQSLLMQKYPNKIQLEEICEELCDEGLLQESLDSERLSEETEASGESERSSRALPSVLETIMPSFKKDSATRDDGSKMSPFEKYSKTRDDGSKTSPFKKYSETTDDKASAIFINKLIKRIVNGFDPDGNEKIDLADLESPKESLTDTISNAKVLRQQKGEAEYNQNLQYFTHPSESEPEKGETERSLMLPGRETGRETERESERESERETKRETERESERDSERETKRETERKTKRETERETERESERETEREPERETKGETERESERETKRETERESERETKRETERESERETKRETERESERETKRETERETKGETERESERETKRETERESERETKRETERESERETKRETERESERETKRETERDSERETVDEANADKKRVTKRPRFGEDVADNAMESLDHGYGSVTAAERTSSRHPSENLRNDIGSRETEDFPTSTKSVVVIEKPLIAGTTTEQKRSTTPMTEKQDNHSVRSESSAKRSSSRKS